MLFVLVTVGTLGCTTTQRDSGNFTRFFIDSLNRQGAELSQFNLQEPHLGIPEHYTDWMYQADAGGFVILMREGQYTYVASGLARILGQPTFADPVVDHEVWADVPGVHVDLVRREDGRVQITCRQHPLPAAQQSVQRRD